MRTAGNELTEPSPREDKGRFSAIVTARICTPSQARFDTSTVAQLPEMSAMASPASVQLHT